MGPLACPPGKRVGVFFSACWQVYSFLDKMSFYNELYKHKPHDVISHEDGTLWRRQTSKLLYPLGKIERPWFSSSFPWPLLRLRLCCFNFFMQAAFKAVLLSLCLLITECISPFFMSLDCFISKIMHVRCNERHGTSLYFTEFASWDLAVG